MRIRITLFIFSIFSFCLTGMESPDLFRLVKKGYAQELKTVITEDTDINQRNKNGDTLLHFASKVAVAKLLVDSGAQQEIAHAVKAVIKKIKNGVITEDQFNEKVLAEHLWTHGIPEPDLIIRTGGRKRLSNFLLFQAAYSELHFLDCLWPDISHKDLEQALSTFEAAARNFGH